MSKKIEKKLRQEEERRRAKRLRQLGWEEVDDWTDRCFQWRCATCKRPRMFVDCGMCFRCEGCFSPCNPDTEAGKQAMKDYGKKGKAICDFDIFGRKL